MVFLNWVKSKLKNSIKNITPSNKNGKKINVLYLSYDGMTYPLGQSQVIPYLVGLSEKGFSFTLISFEKKEKYVKKSELIEKLFNEANIKWIPLRYTKNPPVMSTILDFWKMLIKAVRLNKENKFRIVHCRSYLPSLVGLILKRDMELNFFLICVAFGRMKELTADFGN